MRKEIPMRHCTSTRERTLKAREESARFRNAWAQAKAIIAARKERPAEAWWLSYADENEFRGGLILHSEGFMMACFEACILKLSPHGEVHGAPICPEMAAAIPEKWKNRLLTKAECDAFDAELAVVTGETEPPES